MLSDVMLRVKTSHRGESWLPRNEQMLQMRAFPTGELVVFTSTTLPNFLQGRVLHPPLKSHDLSLNLALKPIHSSKNLSSVYICTE